MLLKHFCLPETHSLERRFDLDWLRVIAFGLLIFFHIGMFYTANWDWHIKSEHRSVLLETLMLALNRWRMPLLWLISGIAMRIVLNKISPQRFITQRSLRLLLPLLFGVLVIVPPQLYYQMLQQGELPPMSYFDFYRAFFERDNPLFENYDYGIWPHIDVNHLWFLRELWTFTIYILLLTPLLRSLAVATWLQKAFNRQYGLTLVALGIVPFFIALLGENENQQGFYFLLLGYLIGSAPCFWQQALKHRRAFLLMAIISYLILALLYNVVWLNAHLRTLLYWRVIGFMLSTVLTGAALLALFGYAKQHLDRPSSTLTYLSEAVLPYYIVHQTVIIVVAYNVSALHWPVALEASVIVLATVAACCISFELIRRTKLLRLLFGLPIDFGGYSAWVRRVIYSVQAIILLPFALQILI